jgi:hypothetical protein
MIFWFESSYIQWIMRFNKAPQNYDFFSQVECAKTMSRISFRTKMVNVRYDLLDSWKQYGPLKYWYPTTLQGITTLKKLTWTYFKIAGNFYCSDLIYGNILVWKWSHAIHILNGVLNYSPWIKTNVGRCRKKMDWTKEILME